MIRLKVAARSIGEGQEQHVEGIYSHLDKVHQACLAGMS